MLQAVYKWGCGGQNALPEERRKLLNLVDEWQCRGERYRLMLILERACNDDKGARELEKMWRSRDFEIMTQNVCDT